MTARPLIRCRSRGVCGRGSEAWVKACRSRKALTSGPRPPRASLPNERLVLHGRPPQLPPLGQPLRCSTHDTRYDTWHHLDLKARPGLDDHIRCQRRAAQSSQCGPCAVVWPAGNALYRREAASSLAVTPHQVDRQTGTAGHYRKHTCLTIKHCTIQVVSYCV